MKKWAMRLLIGSWAVIFLFVISLLAYSIQNRKERAAENKQYMERVERSDKYSDYFFKRTAKVYVDWSRPIASAWYYKKNYWVTAKHVCDYFAQVEGSRPNIELSNNERQLIIAHIVSSEALNTDLCIFKVQNDEVGIEPAQFGIVESQNLYLPEELLVTAGFPGADVYQMRAGKVVGEMVIPIEGREYLEQRVTIWTEPGMSGSAVYESCSKKVVGVVSASDGRYGYIIPLNQLVQFLREVEPAL